MWTCWGCWRLFWRAHHSLSYSSASWSTANTSCHYRVSTHTHSANTYFACSVNACRLPLHMRFSAGATSWHHDPSQPAGWKHTSTYTHTDTHMHAKPHFGVNIMPWFLTSTWDALLCMKIWKRYEEPNVQREWKESGGKVVEKSSEGEIMTGGDRRGVDVCMTLVFLKILCLCVWCSVVWDLPVKAMICGVHWTLFYDIMSHSVRRWESRGLDREKRSLDHESVGTLIVKQANVSSVFLIITRQKISWQM